MDMTGAFSLPPDVLLIPVADLASQVRTQIETEEGDYALTRPRSRSPSKIIDSATAELLRQFRSPRTIVEAVLRYAADNELDPEQTLTGSYPALERIIRARLLVPSESPAADSIDTALVAGQWFGSFEIVRPIQVLEDTELHQARHESGDLVALKIARLRGVRTPDSAFGREAEILGELDGKVNPKLQGRGSLEGRPFLAIEWRDGAHASAAAAALRRSSEQRGDLLRMLVAIVEAYAHLHSQNVVHADVHPRNIIVSRDLEVTILDYGLARAESSASTGVPRGGIGYYFEPEYAQAAIEKRRPPDSTSQSEQYSLATLLYFLCTGRHYVDFSPEKDEMLRQIAEDPPLSFQRRSATPWPEVEAVLSRALSKSPEERYPSMAALAEELAAVSVADAPVRREGSAPQPQADPDRLVDELLDRLRADGTLYRDGIDEPPTASVTYGAAGAAYALYRLASIRDEPTLLALADLWNNRARSSLTQDSGFYSAELEITPETVGRVSPYHTPSGIHCVQALISNAMGDVVTRQEAVEAFVATSSGACDNLDLTLGWSGVLVGTALLYDAIDDEWANRDALSDYGTSVMERIWSQLDGYAPIPECSEIRYLGIAHGWAGLAYAALLWSKVSGAPLPSGLDQRLAELADCAERSGRGLTWKRVYRSGGRARRDDYMSGWCNGPAGMVFLWTLAHDTFGDSAHLDLARGAAQTTWDSREGIGNLCCGLPGRAYALLNIHRATGEPRYLTQARELAGRSAQVDRKHLLGQASLYKGDLALALLADDIGSPDDACMPLFETEGWGRSASNA